MKFTRTGVSSDTIFLSQRLSLAIRVDLCDDDFVFRFLERIGELFVNGGEILSVARGLSVNQERKPVELHCSLCNVHCEDHEMFISDQHIPAYSRTTTVQSYESRQQRGVTILERAQNVRHRLTHNSTKPGFPLPMTLSKLPGTRSTTLDALAPAISADTMKEKENNMGV